MERTAVIICATTLSKARSNAGLKRREELEHKHNSASVPAPHTWPTEFKSCPRGQPEAGRYRAHSERLNLDLGPRGSLGARPTGLRLPGKSHL